VRLLPKLPVKIWIVERADAAFERFGIDGLIKELRSDTQCANSIACSPCGTDLAKASVS
jgi:hypothetical protein